MDRHSRGIGLLNRAYHIVISDACDPFAYFRPPLTSRSGRAPIISRDHYAPHLGQPSLFTIRGRYKARPRNMEESTYCALSFFDMQFLSLPASFLANLTVSASCQCHHSFLIRLWSSALAPLHSPNPTYNPPSIARRSILRPTVDK